MRTMQATRWILFLTAMVATASGQGQQPRDDAAILFSANDVVKAGDTFKRAAANHCPRVYRPLQRVFVRGGRGANVVVRDGDGKVYYRARYSGEASFIVRGALGRHTASLYDGSGKQTGLIAYNVDARTLIDDAGKYKAMFDLLYKGMCAYSPTGIDSIDYNGRYVHYFVPWGLDNCNTLKGMQYFSGVGKELTDVFAEQQRADGMIWSFIARNADNDYFKTAYSPFGFYRENGDVYFVRQPTENHVEYIFVNTVFQCWKASGDKVWMRSRLDAARRALDYSMRDPLRWSGRFQLLKRALTIDSWDFQVDDAYTPQLGIGNAMLVDAKKTKFGIFYGDNTGYAQACRQLAEMLDSVGRRTDAAELRERAEVVMRRLDALAWNGSFFTHFIDEDSTVHRDLGVDMRAQISQSNAYSLNRGLPYAQDTAILSTYLRLKAHLPQGAPAEWYAIYPPFQRGFGAHDAVWQYMNGGVGGHVAGELALGAFDNGYEDYGVDILGRLYSLGRKYGDKIWFAYTGSFPTPPAPVYKTIDLAGAANMDLRAANGKGVPGFLGNGSADGNDLAGLPVGRQEFAGVPFLVSDPAVNGGRAMVAVSSRPGYAKSVTIPVGDTAACIYLLHDATGSDDVCAAVRLVYTDNTSYTSYIRKGRELGGWWFPRLQTDQAGVAWSGPNGKSSKVGIYWAAIANPEPGKPIQEIEVRAADDDAVYALAGLTLSDRPHFFPAKGESFGGPDNWAAATAMAALMQGLAGVTDSGVAFCRPVISPRWIAAGVDSIDVTARYAVSAAYVSYRFRHEAARRRVALSVSGNAGSFSFHVLLPKSASVQSVKTGKTPIPFIQRQVGSTPYVDFTASAGDSAIFIQY